MFIIWAREDLMGGCAPILTLTIIGGLRGLAVAGSPAIYTVAERDAEKARSKTSNNAIWKSICERSSDSLKQQTALEKLQQQVAQQDLEDAEGNQQGKRDWRRWRTPSAK